MSLGDIKKLSTKDVEKYYLRYQTILGKQLSSSLVDSAVLAASKAVSMVVSIDGTEQLYQDLKSDEIIKRELSSFAGLLILKGGRLVALASAFFQVAECSILVSGFTYCHVNSYVTKSDTEGCFDRLGFNM